MLLPPIFVRLLVSFGIEGCAGFCKSESRGRWPLQERFMYDEHVKDLETAQSGTTPVDTPTSPLLDLENILALDF
jgi:hypothetical protein